MLADEALDDRSRAMVQSLLVGVQRDLAMLDSEKTGAFTGHLRAAQARIFVDGSAQATPEFLANFRKACEPYMLIDPGPGLRIIDINDAYAAATLIAREAVVGKGLFEVFPDNPEDSSADGVNNLFASLQIVAKTGEAHAMAIQRYDVRDEHGAFVERHWRPTNTPVFDQDGHLRFILHHVEDVTAEIAGVAKMSSERA